MEAVVVFRVRFNMPVTDIRAGHRFVVESNKGDVITLKLTGGLRDTLQLDNLFIDVPNRVLVVRNETIKFNSKIGWIILKSLVEAYPDVVTRSKLVYDLYGQYANPRDSSFSTTLHNLRARFGKNNFDFIETIHGYGIRLVNVQ